MSKPRHLQRSVRAAGRVLAISVLVGALGSTARAQGVSMSFFGGPFGYGYSTVGFGGFGGFSPWATGRWGTPWVVGSSPWGWGGWGGPTWGPWTGGGVWSRDVWVGGFPGGCGSWGGCGFGGVMYPPLFVQADSIYGPGPVLRLMDATSPQPPVVVNYPTATPTTVVASTEPERQTPAVRASNSRSRALASQLLDAGDVHFREARYDQAYRRYKEATTAAGDWAPARFRQALALSALGRYESAVAEIERGLEFNPQWPVSEFRLDQLFDGNAVLKDRQREVLALAARAHPNDPQPLFLLGILLHFDNQPDRARIFFQRAADLSGRNRAAIDAFLRAEIPAVERPLPPGRDI